MSETRSQSTVKTEQCSLPCHNAEDLVEGGQSAHILLGDQLYTLRITRAGKLILTK
ncbi:hemin uptake protein HemP [Rhodobacteraceae bacterium 63075]|nr:hemin uptake protein HemP [Rhodobacteraceae bacterium 63075]